MDGSSEDWSHGRQLLLERCKIRALVCMNEREYSRAFANFIVALTVQPSVKGEILNAFLFTLEKLSGDLENQKQVNEVLMCYEQALEVLPQDSHVLHGLATTLFRMGYVESALTYFLKSYRANPFFTPSLYCMENLKNALVERWHFSMLNDKHRNGAYKRAIKRAIDDGYNKVLDIGAGTGLLSMMAVDSGAEKVYACESSELMYAILKSVMEENNKDVHTLMKSSMDLKIPDDLTEKVSLIVTEIFDAGLFGENCLETLSHAWDNLLLQEDVVSENENSADSKNSSDEMKVAKPRARIIPRSAEVFAVPVECERFRKYSCLDQDIVEELGLTCSILPQPSEEEPYTTEKLSNLPCSYKFLSEPVSILRADFNSPQEMKSLLQGKVLQPTFTCTESGSVDAFAVWFDLHLDEQETLSTAPEKSSEDCCWEQAVFYVFPQYLEGSPSMCNAGDAIEAEFLCQDHLQLRKVKLPHAGSRKDPSFTMDPALLYLLNSYKSGNVIHLDLKDVSPLDNASILDISTFPALGLKFLKSGTGTVTVLKTRYQDEIERIRDLCGVARERLVFTSYEDLCNVKKSQWDVLVVDPVEMCGLLKKNVIEDVTMLRMRCLKNAGIVIPGKIEIFAVLVESATLKEHSTIISDDRVEGYKISQTMNAYKCQIHQDIQYSKLSHRKISAPFKLSEIDLNARTDISTKSYFTDPQNTLVEVEAFSSGKVNAVVYWFSLVYPSDCHVTTSDGLWKQAACVLDEEVEVTQGETVRLRYSLKNSCFQVRVVNE